MDVLVPVSMKNAAKCDKSSETQKFVKMKVLNASRASCKQEAFL